MRCGNGGDLDKNRKKTLARKVGSVAADPDNLENSKEAGREVQGTQGSRMNCTSREKCSLCRVWSEVFVTGIIEPPLGGSMRMS